MSALIPYINNPRINDNAVEHVAASIREFGFKVPILIDRDNVVIAGHTRLKAAQKLQMEKVPVIRTDDLSPAQVKAFRIADNKLSEIASWDYDKLIVEMEQLKEFDFDIDLTGFSESEIFPVFDPASPESQPRLDQKKPVTCPACGHEFVPDPK